MRLAGVTAPSDGAWNGHRALEAAREGMRGRDAAEAAPVRGTGSPRPRGRLVAPFLSAHFTLGCAGEAPPVWGGGREVGRGREVMRGSGSGEGVGIPLVAMGGTGQWPNNPSSRGEPTPGAPELLLSPSVPTIQV